MEQNTIDIILLATQVLTLVVLIVYVIKTWHIASATKESAKVSQRMLEEMKEARDQEIAPHIVTYFDMPHGNQLIFLIVKNIGKTVAENVKIDFEPKLITSKGDKINSISLIQNGIGSIPPGYSIETFFDSSVDYLSKDEIPLSYVAKITFLGGIKKETRTIQQTLDLSVYKGLTFVDRKGMHELVKETEKIRENLKKLTRTFTK